MAHSLFRVVDFKIVGDYTLEILFNDETKRIINFEPILYGEVFAPLRGTSDANIAFFDLCLVLRQLGFDERIRGSHHIFSKAEVEEILNLQPKRGKAKAYQVKQVRKVILRYRLADES